MQSNQSLRCLSKASLNPWLAKMRTVKILTRLRKNSSLGAHVRKYLSDCVSNLMSQTYALSACTTRIHRRPNDQIRPFRHEELTFTTLGIFNRRQIDDIFFLIFPRKQDLTFHANCLETICMKCHILFSEKNKKNISKCRLLKINSEC